MGANIFLAKPLDMDTLLSHVGVLLQLDWVYDDADLEADAGEKIFDAQTEHSDLFEWPPAPEMEVLYELAMKGNMRDIRQRAAYLAALDVRYAAFADKLRRLADEFQSQAILDIVEGYMKEER